MNSIRCRSRHQCKGYNLNCDVNSNCIIQCSGQLSCDSEDIDGDQAVVIFSMNNSCESMMSCSKLNKARI